MVLEKSKLNLLLDSLSPEKKNLVLTPYVGFILMNEEMSFINNFLKCNDIFRWNIFKNKEEVINHITDFIVRLILDDEIFYLDSGRIMVIKSENVLEFEFELFTSL